MKAIVYTKYGSPEVLHFKEVEKPTPGANEVLVKICAAATNPVDWHLMRASPFFIRIVSGLFTPKKQILGADIAGRVEAVGANVKQFRAGDDVYGEISRGGFAEYVCVPEDHLALKPENISYDAAAAVPVAGLTALQCLRNQGGIKPGQKVLINGASGGVGTYAIQIAKFFGTEVTGVCSSRNVEMVRSIGADHVIDYTQDDFTQTGRVYDLILDNVGNRSESEITRILAPKGTYLLNAFSPRLTLQMMLRSKNGGKTMRDTKLTKPHQGDLVFLKELLEAGSMVSVIDKVYPLKDTAEAIRYLEEGHVRGKVVITVEHKD